MEDLEKLEEKLKSLKNKIVTLYEIQRPLKRGKFNIEKLNKINKQIFNLRQEYNTTKRKIINLKQNTKELQL